MTFVVIVSGVRAAGEHAGGLPTRRGFGGTPGGVRRVAHGRRPGDYTVICKVICTKDTSQRSVKILHWVNSQTIVRVGLICLLAPHG
jgi:hypothetical protein